MVKLLKKISARPNVIFKPADLHDFQIAADSCRACSNSWAVIPQLKGSANYILDFIQENKSEMQPDTIHVDTQGQSTAIFGLV